jgi:hypothetical protein
MGWNAAELNLRDDAMSVSLVGSSTNAPAMQSHATTKSATNPTKHAQDAPYAAAGGGTPKAKDSNGDHKPTATAQTMSSSSVQAAISNLKFGG